MNIIEANKIESRSLIFISLGGLIPMLAIAFGASKYFTVVGIILFFIGLYFFIKSQKIKQNLKNKL